MNPLKRTTIQDCVEIDLMVSAPTERGRYRFTPLGTKRTPWDSYYVRRGSSDVDYNSNKEKNRQTTSDNGEPGVTVVVLISFRDLVAKTFPMFFHHRSIDEAKELLDDSSEMKRHDFLEKVCACFIACIVNVSLKFF